MGEARLSLPLAAEGHAVLRQGVSYHASLPPPATRPHRISSISSTPKTLILLEFNPEFAIILLCLEISNTTFSSATTRRTSHAC